METSFENRSLARRAFMAIVAFAIVLAGAMAVGACVHDEASAETSSGVSTTASAKAAKADVRSTSSYKCFYYIGGSVKIGSAYFSTVSHYDYASGRYCYDLTRTVNGIRSIVATNVYGYILTNGHTIYFSKPLSSFSSYPRKARLYRLNLSTGKKKSLTSGYECSALACRGGYLYYGKTKDGSGGYRLRCLNLKTGKRRYMTNHVGFIKCAKGRVVTRYNSGAFGTNLPMYLFAANGKKIKRLPNGGAVTIKGKRVYYSVIKSYHGSWPTYRIYRCSLNGKGKKAVTKWTHSRSKWNKYFKEKYSYNS